MDGDNLLRQGLPAHRGAQADTGRLWSDARAGLDKLGASLEAVEAAARVTDVSPTTAEREAGNYRKGKVAVHGLVVSVESPRGSYREGVSRDGRKWRTKLHHHYGYFNGTVGADGDHVDVFIGPDPSCELVFVVNQVDPRTRRFDEHKVLLGFTNEADARAGYLACYEDGWRGLGEIKPMTLPDFKNRFLTGDLSKKADHAHPTQARGPDQADRPDEAGDVRRGRRPADDDGGRQATRGGRQADPAADAGHDHEPDADGRLPAGVVVPADADGRGAVRPVDGDGAAGRRLAAGPAAGGGDGAGRGDAAHGPGELQRRPAPAAARPQAAGEGREDDGPGRAGVPAGAPARAEVGGPDGGPRPGPGVLPAAGAPADVGGGLGGRGAAGPEAAGHARVAAVRGDGLRDGAGAGAGGHDVPAAEPGGADRAAGGAAAGEGPEATDHAPRRRRKTVAVDLDGTLAEEYEQFDPKVIGPPRDDVVKWLRKVRATGAVVIIWTVRGDAKLVAAWADRHQIPYDYVNHNPNQPPDSSGKLVADVYVDNRAINAASDWSEFGPAVLAELDEKEDDTHE